ncbi:DUF1456 domain-containing protein [Aliidiomarina taiwanensis]|uniref:DUF1456 domain-containing protein n=1 Tax=Aliidiomarina taiwanensis TaxID=946228 RepID=A0A432X0W4_9GAMM|nr:DUF1456 family protein [Aliidiomarina taiwanensis]RUO39778.1 DUF1456 domain-containing protein [Aliidiomarina taiwanensis]
MTNNDILRRLRYAFDFKDGTMVEIFAAADVAVSQEQVVDWLRKDEDKGFVTLTDKELAIFLNGLINFKRGKREGTQPQPEERLTHNMVLQKLRIALNLKANEMLDIFGLVDFRISSHELSAFFRKPGHKNYRECKDQILRNFLQGVQQKARP